MLYIPMEINRKDSQGFIDSLHSTVSSIIRDLPIPASPCKISAHVSDLSQKESIAVRTLCISSFLPMRGSLRRERAAWERET